MKSKARVKRLIPDMNLCILIDDDLDRVIYVELDELPDNISRSSIVSYSDYKDTSGRLRIKNVKLIGSAWDKYRMSLRSSNK